MANIFRISRALNPKKFDLLKKYSSLWQVQAVSIHTSKKSKDLITLNDTLSVTKPGDKPEEAVSYRSPKNWVSFGFSKQNIVDDSTWCHLIFFFSITVVFCGWIFNIAYCPDSRMMDWTKREAYIELRRREALGLPLVDKNMIPFEKIVLPTDEELGDAEIVI